MTQFFFTVDDYLRLVDELAELGCDKPMLPGVMPFISVAGVRADGRHERHRRSLPPLLERLAAVADQPDEVSKIGDRGGHRARRRPPRRGRPRPAPLRPEPLRESVRQIHANLGLG